MTMHAHKGSPVIIIRDAANGDPGFTHEGQLFVRFGDGSERAVEKDDVVEGDGSEYRESEQNQDSEQSKASAQRREAAANSPQGQRDAAAATGQRTPADQQRRAAGHAPPHTAPAQRPRQDQAHHSPPGRATTQHPAPTPKKK